MKYFFVIMCLYFGYVWAADNDAWNPVVDECPAWEETCIPTVTNILGLNITKATDDLYEALRDENHLQLITIVTKISASQRRDICSVYASRYGQTLTSALTAKLRRGSFRNLIQALIQPMEKFYGTELKNAINGILTNFPALIEIMGTLSNKGMKAVIDCYENGPKQIISNDLICRTYAHFTSEDFGKFLEVLAKGCKFENATIFESEIQDQVYRLKKAESKRGTDYLVFCNILFQYNYLHLRNVFDAFKKSTTHTLGESLGMGMGSTDRFRNSLIAMYEIINNRAEYFAERLHASLNRWFLMFSDHNTVNRIIVGRAEIDTGNIKSAYQMKYNEPLTALIKRKTTGPYQHALLSLIGN